MINSPNKNSTSFRLRNYHRRIINTHKMCFVFHDWRFWQSFFIAIIRNCFYSPPGEAFVYDANFKGPSSSKRSQTDVSFLLIFGVVFIAWLSIGFSGKISIVCLRRNYWSLSVSRTKGRKKPRFLEWFHDFCLEFTEWLLFFVNSDGL